MRQALGYEQIHLQGGSFGTYAAVMYMRAHPERVRSAYLLSLVTLDNRVPLYHAQSAQWALGRLFEQCRGEPACRERYPRLRADFQAVLQRLRRAPVVVKVADPDGGAPVAVRFTAEAFADAVRVKMYSGSGGRELPPLVAQARRGRFDALAAKAMAINRGFYSAPWGLYYAVTCNEFVARIRPDEIGPVTRSTYLGATRVNEQSAACLQWPKTQLAAGYFEPFRIDVPILLVSGDTDPVTPPYWGERALSFMPNAVHVTVAGGHVPRSDCTDAVANDLFRTNRTSGLDLGCVAKISRASFK